MFLFTVCVVLSAAAAAPLPEADPALPLAVVVPVVLPPAIQAAGELLCYHGVGCDEEGNPSTGYVGTGVNLLKSVGKRSPPNDEGK